METGKVILPPPPLRLPEGKPETFRFVLGHRDAEMDEIENVLREEDVEYTFATHEGERVTPRNCYEADPIELSPGVTIVLVECHPREFLGSGLPPRLIDHHRPYDPGFGLSAEQFWEASSLGQVYAALKRSNPTEMHLVVAARDHCRFDAELGLCPGVDPKKIRTLGHHHLCQELGVSMQKLQATIRRMKRIINGSPKMLMGNQMIVDLRAIKVPRIYCLEYLSIYEALAETNCVALIMTKNKLDDPANKAVLIGCLEPETVGYFMEIWGPAQGLLEIYGDKVRKYAGGYYPAPKVMAVKAA